MDSTELNNDEALTGIDEAEAKRRPSRAAPLPRRTWRDGAAADS